MSLSTPSTALLGIVIPTRNAAATIGHTLAALSSASVELEVVVVDGESQDATVTIAQAFGAKTTSIPPRGIYEAVNHGVRTLSTPWVTYINADDVLYGDCLDARLAGSTHADIIYGSVDFVDDMGRFLHRWKSARPGLLLPLFRAGYSPLLQQGTLFRRTVFEAIGGFDTSWKLVADADFWFRSLLAHFRFARDSSASVAAFRMHRNQLSRKMAGTSAAEHRAMTDRNGRQAGLSGVLASIAWRASNWRSYCARLERFPQSVSAYAYPSSSERDVRSNS